MSGEHEKALNDLAQHTGDSTTDRLERLKRIEQLRLQGYQKVKSLSEEKSGTSPTRRSYTSFSQETSPSFYGSLGRINHLEGVKPKSYSSKSFQDPTQSLSQRTRSSSLSDDDENEPPKQLLRSKSATTVSDTGLTAFEFGGEQNISYNPMGSEEEHWRERNDSYNEEDENIEDFKKSLYGDTSFFAKKSSPRTDRTLKAFSLSREWSSGGAEYEDSEGQGHQMEAGEDNSETFSMFPSYNSEFLGMNYGETFENPNSYGTTIRKSFSRERSRQPLLRSFSSQNETAPNSSLGYSAESRRNTSRLDSALDQIFTPSAVTTERSSLRSSGYDRQGRLDSALDSLYSRGGSTRDISGLSSRLRDHYTSGSDSSYTERKKIALSSEAESKLDQLFGPPTSSVLSNRPSFTSTSRRSETPAVRSRADRITITRIKSNSAEGRQMGVNYLIDQNRENSYRASDVPSTMVYGGENYNTSQITEDTRMRQHSAQSSLDQKLDNIFNVPDVLSTSMMDRENSMETGIRENPVQSTDLDQKLDSLFQVPNDLSTSMMKNESSKLTQSRRQVLNNKAKPTLTSMLYGEENHSMEPGVITETMEDFTDTWYDRSLVDGDMNDTNMDNLEYVDQAPVSEIEILGDVPEEVSLLEKITEEEDIGTEICGNHGDGEEYVNEEETQGLMNDLTHGSETVEISQNLPQSDEGVKTEVSPDKSQVTNGQVTKGQVTNGQVTKGQVTNGQVTRVQQNQMSTKGKQADSKKNKKKSKGKKNKGKKGQKEKVDKVDENPMTAKDCGKCVLETDIDAALGQVDQQNIDNVVEETSSLCVELSERQNSVERENSVSAEKIQKTEEGESNIDLENEEEENYVEANEATERYSQLKDEGAKEEVLKDEKKSDVESETITENEVNEESKQTSRTENTSWFRSKFNSLIHGFGTDSNANKIENEAQQKLENIQTVSKSEDVSTVNGDMNMNVATASDTGTVSEDDYATASDNDTTKVNDEYYETDYSQSVLNSNLKNDKISSEVSSENEAMDIFNELAVTTGMSLDRGEQFEDCGDVKGQVMYEREEEILRGDNEKIPGNIVEFEDNGWNVVVKQQEMRSQNKEHVMLSDGINKMEEIDLNYQENRHNLPQLGTNLLNKNEAGVSCQMDVKPSVCTTEISIQTDVEAYLTIDKVSTSVQTLPCKLDKWTQTDMETVVESKELGIQASPATADYSDQYNVSVKDSGVQVVHKCETEQVQVDLKTVPEHVKPEQLVSEQMVSKQFSSEQVVPECLSSSQQVKLEHLSSEQIHLKQHSSQQVKLEHLSSEQTQSKLSSGPVKLVKPEQLSSEPVKSGVRVDSTLIVTDKVTPEYAVAEHIKIERVVPEQVKMVSRQTSRTAEDISSTMSSNHMNEDLLKDVGHSSDVKPEVKVPDVNVKNSGRPGDTKVSESVEGQVTVTSSETINAWSKPVAAPSEISFSSQSLSNKGPPQTLPKRRSKHGGSKPSSRPSSFVAEGDGFDFHSSEQSAANLESSSFNFNKILPKTETTAPKMTSEKTELDNTKVVGIVKSEVSSPLSPRAKEFGMIPTGSSGTLLTAVVGPKSPRSQLEHGLDGKEWSSTSASSNTGVTSPRSSLSGMSSLSSHGNKGHVKSPPPALLPKRKATTQLQMPTSPKSPTSPRSSEKVELWQEYDPVFTKQMKMNNGEQKIVKEPINRLKDNPFIRKDGNVKTGRQESFSKKCETLTTSKPRTLSSSLTPKSPKEEHKRSGDIPTQGKDTAVDLNVLDSKSLRLEIIRQSTSRSNTKNVTKGTKNVENTKSKMETSTDSSVRKASESSTIVNKIISDAAKFEAKFSSGSNQNVEASSALGCVPLERDNPFIMSEKGTSGTESIKTSFHSSSLIEHHQSYMETSIDGEEEPNFTVSHTEKVVSEAGGDRRNSSVTQADNLDDTDISTVIQTDKIQDQEQENKIVPPQRKRKLRVEVPSPVKSGDSLESEDAPDSPSLASLVSSELQEIGVGEIAGLSMKPAKSQKSSSTNGVKVNVEIAQQNAAQQQPSPKTGKPPSPLSGKPPSPKTGKPPSPKTGKTPSPKVGKPSSPSKEQPSGENRPLSPRVGKTPPSPQNRKSPSPKLTTPSTPKGSKQKSSSTPPSPGGRPMSPRVKQSPLSKAMFGDRENGKSGNNVYSDTRSRRRSSEKTGSISSRTSSVSSEGSSSTIEKGKNVRQESSRSRQKGSKEAPPVPDKPEGSLSGQKGTKKAPPVPEKPKRTSSLKKDKHSHMKETESSASKSKGKGGFSSFLTRRKSSK